MASPILLGSNSLATGGGGGGGGGSLDVLEEASTVVAAASALRFNGASVTVTNGGGGTAVVTITDASLTTEEVQDIVGALLQDNAVSDVVYDDAGNALTITLLAGAVANSMLANMAQGTFKMRAAAAGTGAPIDGTAAQAKTALAIVSADISDLSSVVPGYGTTTRVPASNQIAVDNIWRTKTVNQYYFTNYGVTNATQVLVQDRLYLMPVLLPPGTIDRIGVDCVTGVASLVCRLGIYSATADMPNALIAEATSTGSLATSATVVNLTISAAIPDLAIYYFGVICQGATPVGGSVRCNTSGNFQVPNPLSTVTPTSVASASGARFSTGHSGAMPTNPTISNTLLGEFMPRFHYRYSA